MSGSTDARVAAVVPVYNGEKYIVDALHSVLDQDYPVHQLIVVNDGSTDGTLDAVAALASSRVTVVNQQNQGVSAARNRGLAEATTEYVAFLDADDVWMPTKLSRQMALFSKRPELAMTYTALTVVNEELAPIGYMQAPTGDQALRNTLLLDPPVISVAQTAVVRRQVLEALGGFDERLTTSADSDLACRVALRHPVEGVPDPLVLYRQHDSQMHLNADAMLRDMCLVYDKVFNDPALPMGIRSMRGHAWANLHLTVGAAALGQGDLRQAARHLRSALQVAPVHAVGRSASILWQRGTRAARAGKRGRS